jgi:hypothetical protein
MLRVALSLEFWWAGGSQSIFRYAMTARRKERRIVKDCGMTDGGLGAVMKP